MIYGDERYSRVQLVVGIGQLYYKVDTFVCDSKSSINDLFPSVQFSQYVDLIYCIDTNEFIKFRWEPRQKAFYSDFFSYANIRKITLVELKSIIEDFNSTKIKIWNPGKWNVFTTQV